MNFMVHLVAKGNVVNSLLLMDFHGAEQSVYSIAVATVSKCYAFLQL